VKKLTPDQAKALLLAGDSIHTFVRSMGWMGCDVDRETVLKAIDANKGANLRAEAAWAEHDMALLMKDTLTYIETDQAVLADHLSCNT